MRQTHQDKVRHFRHLLVVLVAVIFAAVALLLLNYWDKQQGEFEAINYEEKVIKINGKEYEKKENIETFLLLGLDKYVSDSAQGSYTNDMQADYLLLLVFDNINNTSRAVQINRDTMAPVNVLGVAGQKVDTKQMQIALAHTYGNGEEVSCYNTAESVSELFYGAPIEHFLSATIDSIAVVNDLVGGVEVEVLDSFEGIDSSLVKGEKITLTGEQATTYVRSRYGMDDSSNMARMERQIQYMNALQDKAQYLASTDENFIIDASLTLSQYIVSDRSVNQLQELAEKFSEYEFLGIETLKGEIKKGEQFLEFYPNENHLTNLAVELFYTPKN